jgi:3-hydroxybutyryl-CoA dehydrogenase
MRYSIVQNGESRSFPKGDPFLNGATTNGDVAVYLNAPFATDGTKTAILVELETECLGVHTGQQAGEEGSNVLGFARYRNGDDPPSKLVELVRQPNTEENAIAAARAIFEAAGLAVVVCSDQPGRIIDRLVRPKYNAALRFLDEGLATAKDMDLTCRLGLGYPDGPIERVERGSLARHHDVTRALFDAFGTSAYAPAPRALVAKQREAKS